MRTTVRIEDELMEKLKAHADSENLSLTDAVNQMIRRGLSATHNKGVKKPAPFVQKTYNMGVPRFDVTKALALAAELEEEDILRKMALGK
jgi:hypothetical protein